MKKKIQRTDACSKKPTRSVRVGIIFFYVDIILHDNVVVCIYNIGSIPQRQRWLLTFVLYDI